MDLQQTKIENFEIFQQMQQMIKELEVERKTAFELAMSIQIEKDKELKDFYYDTTCNFAVLYQEAANLKIQSDLIIAELKLSNEALSLENEYLKKKLQNGI